jgi:inorganic triphosphatase YgiF
MGYAVELKLSINKADANKLHRIPVMVNSVLNKPTPHKISSIYFDTPELQLLEAGVTLCIRHESHAWVQSISLSGATNFGLHEMWKWESLVHTGLPDFTKIKHPILIEFFSDKNIRSSLMPIFKTDVMRTLWQLAFENGDQLELSLDSGLLTSNQQPEPINLFLLTLKAGNIGRVFDIALLLQKAIPLNIENASKAKRGCPDYLAGAERACKS